jgi:hypothetical protein
VKIDVQMLKGIGAGVEIGAVEIAVWTSVLVAGSWAAGVAGVSGVWIVGGEFQAVAVSLSLLVLAVEEKTVR